MLQDQTCTGLLAGIPGTWLMSQHDKDSIRYLKKSDFCLLIINCTIQHLLAVNEIIDKRGHTYFYVLDQTVKSHISGLKN